MYIALKPVGTDLIAWVVVGVMADSTSKSRLHIFQNRCIQAAVFVGIKLGEAFRQTCSTVMLEGHDRPVLT
jgi:hypothetical protein